MFTSTKPERSYGGIDRARRRGVTTMIALVALCALVLGVENARAATTILAPTADSYVYSGASGTNYGTATAFKHSASTYRGLITFDTSTIPAGSTINSVGLRLYYLTAPGSGGTAVRPEAGSWAETGVTWANQPAWSSTVLATSATPTANNWTTIALPVSAVTKGGLSSFGMSYTTSGIIVNVASRESANAPQLLVDYTAGAAASPPSATTGGSSNVTSSGATVSGTANDNRADTTCRFQYGTALNYGSSTSTQTIAAGAGSTALAATLSGLDASTTYNYRLSCSNTAGTTNGANATFTTAATPPPPTAPAVTTGTASGVTTSAATLNGTANDNRATTTCQFDYGTAETYGNQTPAQTLAAGGGARPVTATVAGLTAGTLYNFRLRCSNSAGPTNGANATFTTSALPVTRKVTKILTIVEENHGLASMLSGMPYLGGLAKQYSYADNYHALAHPSLPNYLAMAAGSTFGVTSNCAVSTCPRTGPTVFDQAIAAGKSARVYAEDMTSNCQTSGSGAGRYTARHTAWPYFTDATSRANCNANQVPSGTYTSGNFRNDVAAGSLPNIGWLIPNLCNDAHDCALGVADSWLKNMLPLVFAGPDWTSGRLAVVVTADEDGGSSANAVLTVVLHPDLNGRLVTTSLNHYSLAKLQEQVAGVTPYLNNAAGAPDMASAFGLTVGP
ncbi:MAG: phosphatidylinositol-3-phosphatase [Gaiellales bacterium]|nr:phosphatidylinositol-3-phosphatase [Gaiellales bacterium]